jgi:hypothetical protein
MITARLTGMMGASAWPSAGTVTTGLFDLMEELGAHLRNLFSANLFQPAWRDFLH